MSNQEVKKKIRLHVFNPDCELAIANGGRHYMPSANVIRMAEDLAFLPAYWAEEGDWVLVKEAVYEDFGRELGLQVRCVTEEEVEERVEVEGAPWGRSPKMCHWLAERGMGEEWREEWKEWYSRKTALWGLRWLRERMPFVEERTVPKVCSSLEDIRSEVAGERGTWVVKSPWSSSGKGQLRCKGEPASGAEEWIKGVLRRQGYAMLERYLDKVQDFAMEFQATGRGAEFIGWSLFTTGERGEYQGNAVASQTYIEGELVGLLGEGVIQSLKCNLPQMLAELLPDYRGYLGVDMMVYRDDEGVLRVHPCVEINLRFNMGMVALFLSRDYVAKGTVGRFTISFYNREGEACEEHGRLCRMYPGVYENNRMKSGYFALTPVKKTTRFVASLRCY